MVLTDEGLPVEKIAFRYVVVGVGRAIWLSLRMGSGYRTKNRCFTRGNRRGTRRRVARDGFNRRQVIISAVCQSFVNRSAAPLTQGMGCHTFTAPCTLKTSTNC